MSNSKYNLILAKQLAMNEQTWSLLQTHGLTVDSKLRLDFFYNAPTRETAQGLCALIHNKTDYKVRVVSHRRLFRREWGVNGTTQLVSVSLQILNEWVAWMVAAGAEHSCDFDGWGASIQPPSTRHAVLGELYPGIKGGFENPDFELWGHSPVQLLIDAPQSGPTAEQVDAFRRFCAARDSILDRSIGQMNDLRREMELPPATFAIATLSIPSLGDEASGKLWTLWFDAEGDDHYLYGVQTEDDWQTLHAFADD